MILPTSKSNKSPTVSPKSGPTISRFISEIRNLEVVFEYFNTIGIICHDTGCSNVLAQIAKILSYEKSIQLYLSGPAVEIFAQVGLKNSELQIKQVVDASDVVVTGTGWQSGTENEATRLARLAGKTCFVLLDHWQDFRSRFTGESLKTHPPTSLIVTNTYAQNLASSSIPEIPCIQVEDFFLKDILNKISEIGSIYSESILYLSNGQPFTPKSPFSQLPQLSKVQHLLELLPDFNNSLPWEVILRPHPADNPISGINFENLEFHLRIFSGDFVTQLNSARFIVGADTYALYIAMKIGKPVITVMTDTHKPDWLDFAPTVEALSSNEFLKQLYFKILHFVEGGFYLRIFSILDIDNNHLSNLNDFEHMRFSSISSTSTSFEDAARYTKDLIFNNGYHLAIVNLEHKRVGTCTLRVHLISKKIELGILIYKHFSGEGIGSRVWRRLTKQLSSIFPQYTIWAGTLDTNSVMKSILRKSGYSLVKTISTDYLARNTFETIAIYEFDTNLNNLYENKD